MALKTIKRSKPVQHIKDRLPDNIRTKVGDVGRWWDYVFYRRFFKRKFLALFSALGYLFKPLKEEKRILGIWNFAATPPTIGVFLEFQIRLLCMSYLNGSCKIDIAFIYDPSKAIVGPKYDWVNQSNFHYHFGEMYPMLNILPSLGSVFLFNSHNEFEKFYLNNEKRYIPHPTFFEYIQGSDSRPNLPFIRDFYLKEKFLPKFEFKPATLNWAKAFIKKYAGDDYIVAVSLRRNVAYTQNRNSSLEEWEKFFEYCLGKKYKVKFVILGRQNEVRGLIKELPNLIYSQVENANIEQNLALIEMSLIYMATIFGPASFPLLTDYIPFVLTNYDNPERIYDYKWLKKGGYFPWQNIEIQKLVWERETRDVLIKNFDIVFSKVNKEGWRRKLGLNEAKESSLEWPHN